MAKGFMNGMISGFMAGFGGAGGMGGLLGGGADAGAADAAAATDASTAATSGAAADSSAASSQVAGAGTSATNTGAATGDIERTYPGDLNPADTQAKVAAANKPAEDNAGQMFGKALQQAGKQMQQNAATRKQSGGGGGGDAYNAMFGTTGGTPAKPAVQMQGGGSMITPTQMGTAQIPAPPPPAPIQPPPQAPPLQMQLPQQQMVPQIPLGSSVSDMRHKAKILNANKELDAFLNKIYTNVTTRNK